MTESSSIVIIEAGGHGRAVLDVALSSGRKVLAFIYEAIVGQDMLGVPIVGKANDISLASDYAFFVATGDNRSMQIVFEKTRQRMGHDGVMLIHQTAYALPSIAGALQYFDRKRLWDTVSYRHVVYFATSRFITMS